jgi:hypothetical protein
MKCSKANRHARKIQNANRAPAAITPLDAASRRASHPPSNPLVLPPKLNPVSNDWVLPLFIPFLFSFVFLFIFATHHLSGESFRLDYQFRPATGVPSGAAPLGWHRWPRSRCDEICHSDSDVFCLFDLQSSRAGVGRVAETR